LDETRLERVGRHGERTCVCEREREEERREEERWKY
jgi:hypothetical protein